MNLIDARLYDGKSTECHSVQISVNEEGKICLLGYKLKETLLSEVSISSRIGNSARYLDFSNGIRIEADDNDEIDRWIKLWKPNRKGLLHRIEINPSAVIGSLVVLVVSLVVIGVYGIPAMSAPIVRALPLSVDDLLGEEVLAQLDSVVFKESTLDPEVREGVRTLFESLLPTTERDFDLQFRSSEVLGANAFALPNAQIILTDDLIQLSDSDEMLAAIILHEIGHVVERHTMQSVVRRAGLSILLFGVTGDVGSAATTLVVLLPNFLVESSYSRDLEWAADSYALEQMSLRGLDANAFAEMMELILESSSLENKTVESEKDNAEGVGRYFGSHPPTQDRIDRFRQASR